MIRATVEDDISYPFIFTKRELYGDTRLISAKNSSPLFNADKHRGTEGHGENNIDRINKKTGWVGSLRGRIGRIKKTG
jgi:hypothetical protein